MARSSLRRSLAAVAVAACAVVVMGDDAQKADPAAQKQANQAASAEAMTKWASVLANAFMASGSPDQAVNNIAAFNSYMQEELSSQSKKWQSFQSENPSHRDVASDLRHALRSAIPFSHPIPEISITDPTFFNDGTANFTSVAAGVALSSAFINYAPCIVPITPAGVDVDPQGINIQPEVFGINPQAFNVQPQGISIAPTLILVAPIGANIQPNGFTVAPALFSISPVKTVIQKTGPVNVADSLISATIPRGPGP